MKKYVIPIGFLAIAIILFSSCKEKEDPQYSIVDHWIYDAMTQVYLWYDKIPADKQPSGFEEPKAYFNSLLYKEEDRFSFITDDYTGLMAEFDGNPKTMGFSPAFSRYYRGSDSICIIVEYVYDNSPAQRAGLKRGDIIIKINDQQLNISNYADLSALDNYTATLGIFNGSGLSETSQKITMTAEVVTINPIIKDTIYQINGQNIGYLAVSEFTSEDPFVQGASPAFMSLKSQNISNLVVDLRYNRGGDMQAAIWLASALAPYQDISNQELLVTLQYNNLLQDYMDSQNRTNYRFKYVNNNLNLQTIYFLTTNYSTASASELVIVGLEPYMNVVQVGENTVGKYTGMWAIPDTQDPPRHNWGILPIVMKYANAAGKTDFKDGLAPDYYVEDDLLHTVPLGDITDPQLSKAIELITGMAPTARRKSLEPIQELVKITTPKQLLKSNLFVK